MVTSLPLAALYTLAFLLSYRPTVAGFRAALNRQDYFELSVLASVFPSVFVWVSFPQNPSKWIYTLTVPASMTGFCGKETQTNTEGNTDASTDNSK